MTTESSTVKLTTEHFHLPIEAKLEAEKLKSKLTSKAKETTAPVPRLYNEALQEVRTFETETISNKEAVSNFQTLTSIKTALYRARREGLRQIPTTRDDISIKGEWAVTSANERFFYIRLTVRKPK